MPEFKDGPLEGAGTDIRVRHYFRRMRGRILYYRFDELAEFKYYLWYYMTEEEFDHHCGTMLHRDPWTVLQTEELINWCGDRE